MVSFASLLRQMDDPARQRRLVFERQLAEIRMGRVERAVALLITNHDQLSEREQSLARSVQSALGRFMPLSDAQSAWLFDIANRFDQTFRRVLPGALKVKDQVIVARGSLLVELGRVVAAGDGVLEVETARLRELSGTLSFDATGKSRDGWCVEALTEDYLPAVQAYALESGGLVIGDEAPAAEEEESAHRMRL